MNQRARERGVERKSERERAQITEMKIEKCMLLPYNIRLMNRHKYAYTIYIYNVQAEKIYRS